MKTLLVSLLCLAACTSLPSADDVLDAKAKALAVCAQASALDARAKQACDAMNDALKRAHDAAKVVVELTDAGE